MKVEKSGKGRQRLLPSAVVKGVYQRGTWVLLSAIIKLCCTQKKLKQLEVRTMSSKKLCQKPLFYNKNIATYSAN